MNVMPSTGSVSHAYDNAMAENFFATLEKELLATISFPSIRGLTVTSVFRMNVAVTDVCPS
jgi:hypothetical protein